MAFGWTPWKGRRPLTGVLPRRQVSVAVALRTCIQEVLSSNVAQGTGYPEDFSCFPQSLPATAWMAFQLGHDRFLPNLF
jgi:hypothetical protein